MRAKLVILLIAVAASGCGTHNAPAQSNEFTSEQQTVVTQNVQAFMDTVAKNITQNGPGDWRKHFVDDPAFFMAADGNLVYANSDAATKGMQDLTNMFKAIELHWGGTPRVDPLTPTLAMVANPYSEVLTTSDGQQLKSDGYFTGLVQNQNGTWKFRNAHWSASGPPMKVQ